MDKKTDRKIRLFRGHKMTKLVSVTTRLDLENLECIKKISKMLSLDKSTAFREILQKGVQEDKKEKALEFYMKGKFSIEQAAKFAGMYLGDFFDLMRQKGIESNMTLEDFDESVKNLKMSTADPKVKSKFFLINKTIIIYR